MASGTRPLGGGSCSPERAAALAKIATLSGQAMEQLVPDPMGVLNASSRMIRILAKDTVYGAIGNQIFQPIWVFASRERAMSFMGEATMGMEELTHFPGGPVAAAQMILAVSWTR